MSKKTHLEKVEETKREAETKISTVISNAHQAKNDTVSLLKIGAVGAIGRLSQNLSAQTIRALQTVRDEKHFEALGFTRFDDFLDESEYSPMSYRQFNDREKLLLAEGDQVFDLLTQLKLSQKQRKMLGAGHIQIDETKGTVLIVTGEDLEEEVEEIELTDRTRLLQTLSALADQNSLLNVKTNRQREQIEKGVQETERLRKQVDEAKNKPGTVTFADLCIRVNTTIQLMCDFIPEASDLEMAHSGLYLESIKQSVEKLEKAFPLMEMTDSMREARVAKKLKNFPGSGSDENEFAVDFNDKDLADLME